MSPELMWGRHLWPIPVLPGGGSGTISGIMAPPGSSRPPRGQVPSLPPHGLQATPAGGTGGGGHQWVPSGELSAEAPALPFLLSLRGAETGRQQHPWPRGLPLCPAGCVVAGPGPWQGPPLSQTSSRPGLCAPHLQQPPSALEGLSARGALRVGSGDPYLPARALPYGWGFVI